MFKKIALFGFLCLSTVQANWQVNTGSKVLHTSLALVGVSAASYTIYKMLNIVIDRLESDNTISHKKAQVLRGISKINAPLLILTSAYYKILSPREVHSFTAALQTVWNSFRFNLGLLDAPSYAWNILQRLI